MDLTRNLLIDPAGTYQAFPLVRGLVEPGNLDLNKRPVVRNPNGSTSTELSFSINRDGKEVLLPQVVNGQVVSPADAVRHYLATGEHLGKFASVEDANKYAQSLHERQNLVYSAK